MKPKAKSLASYGKELRQAQERLEARVSAAVKMQGVRLKKARQAAGMSQPDFARCMGLTPATVCNFETGKANFSIQSLIRAALVLGCTTDHLLGLEA